MKIAIILVSICFALSTYSQNYKFGKVSKEELQETFNPLDTTANATYLYKNRYTYFQYVQTEGFKLVTEVHERVKIYNQQGFDYATKQVRLYVNGSGKEEISGIKGNTYNLIDGKVEDFKLTKDGVFNSEISKYTNQVKFTMPNIKPGSVIEYKYKINSPFISKVDEFVFQYDIPSKKIESKFEVPEYFNFRVNTKGFLRVIPEKEVKRGKLSYKTEVPPQDRQFSNKVEYYTGEVEYAKDIFKYNLENVAALKQESYVNNMDNYRSSIKYELSYTKFPQSTINHYSTTWEDVVETIYKSSNFGNELDKDSYYEEDIDALINHVSDPIKKVELIFNFVKSKIKWNGYMGYYTDKGVKKAYKERVGNVADINLMLISMLRYAGVNAHPILVSTRANGIPLFPTLDGYNYVVAYVKQAETVLLLDATSLYSAPNVLPFRALNWQGRIITEHGGSAFIDLYPEEISKKTTTMMVSLDEAGTIEGGLRNSRDLHKAYSFRENYNETNKDEFLEKLENQYGGMEVSDYEVNNDFDLYKPIIESYKFLKESQADIIGDKMFFSPLFFLKTSENPFKLEKREFPVDFGYPSISSQRIIITIPDAYKIESLPEPEAFMLPDNLGLFKYNISAQGNRIQLVVESQINESVITPLYYEALKAYFSKLVEKEAEQIVLTKT